MNNVSIMSRKALTMGVVLSTILWSVMAGVLVAPMKASAGGCTSGSLIKGSLAAVYYCGADGKRYVFPNEKTYFTWYSDFSTVIIISDADLANIMIGGNVTYRPGVKLVKIQSDPKTYAVSKGGVLRHVTSEALAVSLYGSDWNTNDTEDVSDAFFTNYTVGAPINSASEYNPSAEMSGSQTINQDKNLSGTGTVSGLFTAKASDSPAGATLPKGAMGVNFLKFNVTNGSSSAVTVDSVTLHRSGPGASGDISAVYLYEGSSRLTTGRSINSSTNEATFTGVGLSLASGQTRTLSVLVDVATTALAGNVHAMGVLSVMVGTNEAVGTPFYGSNFTLAGSSVGSLTINKTGTITNPRVGEPGVKIAEFTLASGASEDVRLNRLTVFQGGNLAGANLTNLVLKQAGGTFATSAGFDSKLRATFEITGGFLIEKGQTKTFQVYADIGGTARSGDEIKIYVEEDGDVHGIGQTFGYGVTVNRNSTDTPSGSYDGASCTSAAGNCSFSTVEAGQVTLNFLGPSSMDIAENGNDIEVLKFSMVAQSNIEVRNLRLQITSNDLIDGTAVYTDVKVVNTATGATWWGPMDVDTDTGSDNTEALVFNDVQTLQAGATYTFSVKLDVENTAADGDTVTVSMNAFGTSDLRNLDNSTFLTPSTDVVPAGGLTGNQMTVRVPSLTTSLGSTPVSQTYIKGSTNVDFTGVNLNAGDASDITVSAVTVTGWIDADGGATMIQGFDDNTNDASVADVISQCRLMDGTAQVGLTRSPSSSATEGSGGTMQFTGLNLVITKGQTKSLKVNCDISNSAFAGGDADTVGFSVQAAGDVTAQDPDGNSVTPTGTANASAATVAHTIQDTGTMSYVLAPDDTESEAGLVISGSSNVVLGKLRLTAQNEELKQTKIRISLVNAVQSNVIDMSLYDGSTLVAGPVPLTGQNADFSNMNFVVPKDGSKTLTVKATLNTISGGATSGADLQITTDLSSPAAGTFEYRGTSSSTVVTTIAGTDITANSKILRKTKLTVSNAALSSLALEDGDRVVSRFTLTADSAGQASVKTLFFNLAKSQTLNVAFASIREVGVGTAISASNTDASACLAGVGTACTIKVMFASEQSVSAGTSKTYELHVTVTTSASGNSISTTLGTDTAQVTGELEDFGKQIDDLDGTDNTGAYNFIWSDNSAIPHNDTVDTDDTTDDATASNDWTNGRFVKVLPNDTQTLTK